MSADLPEVDPALEILRHKYSELARRCNSWRRMLEEVVDAETPVDQGVDDQGRKLRGLDVPRLKAALDKARAMLGETP